MDEVRGEGEEEEKAGRTYLASLSTWHPLRVLKTVLVDSVSCRIHWLLTKHKR